MAYKSSIRVWLCKACDAAYIRRYHASAHVREAHGVEPGDGLVEVEVELKVGLEAAAGQGSRVVSPSVELLSVTGLED